MKACPFCAEMIQSEAIKCRFCGEFLDKQSESDSSSRVQGIGYFWGYEYRSQAELFGLPLVHINQGASMRTGLPRIARGIIAIGNIAVGFFALGGISFGGIAIGGISFGVLALGGITLGVITLGGLSMGILFAIGGLAISFFAAVGGLALAPNSIDSQGIDTELMRLLDKFWRDMLGN